MSDVTGIGDNEVSVNAKREFSTRTTYGNKPHLRGLEVGCNFHLQRLRDKLYLSEDEVEHRFHQLIGQRWVTIRVKNQYLVQIINWFDSCKHYGQVTVSYRMLASRSTKIGTGERIRKYAYDILFDRIWHLYSICLFTSLTLRPPRTALSSAIVFYRYVTPNTKHRHKSKSSTWVEQFSRPEFRVPGVQEFRSWVGDRWSSKFKVQTNETMFLDSIYQITRATS